MSKKVNTKVEKTQDQVATTATITNSELNTKVSVESLLAQHESVSLRKLAITTDTTYTLLLKASKKPLVGTPYDPTQVNYQEIASYFNRRKIALDELDWASLEETTQRSGNVIKDVSKFEVGQKVYLRKHATTPYTILLKTETHIVVMLDGTTEPQSWSHNTFLLYGPQLTARAEKREQVAEEAESKVAQ